MWRCGAGLSPERIGFEGGAEDETSFAEREAGQGRKMPPDELPVRMAASLFRAAHTSDGARSGAGWRIGQMRSQSPQPVQASAWTAG